MKFRTRHILGVVVIGLLFIGWQFVSYIWGGSIKATLDPALVPTAQQLLNNPPQKPPFIWDVYPSEGSTISTFQKICVDIAPGALSEPSTNVDVDKTVRITINGQKISRNDLEVTILDTLNELTDGSGRWSGVLPVCFTPVLNPGIHLLQVQASSSALGVIGLGGFDTYNWVYKVSLTPKFAAETLGKG